MSTTAVEKARDSVGWTQDELAEKSGVPQGSISRIERGGVPQVVTALRLARALKTTAEDLFRDHLRADDLQRKRDRRETRSARRAA